MSEKMPTQDGEPIRVNQLNIGNEPAEPEGLKGRVSGFFQKVSLFLAGMYTGVGCGGTPNRYHSYDRKKDDGPV